MIARHWLRQPVGLPPRLLPGSVGLDNRRLRVAHDGGTARARHSSPLLLWLLLLDGLAAEGRRLGDCYADIGTSMPYAASPGCWSTTGSAGAVIHGRRGGRAIKSRQDGTRSRVLETTHERRGSMGRVKCSRRGGTTTDNDGDGVCGRRGLYVFLSGNLGSRGGRGGTKLAENTKPFSRKCQAGFRTSIRCCPDMPDWSAQTHGGSLRRQQARGQESQRGSRQVPGGKEELLDEHGSRHIQTIHTGQGR